MQRFVSKVLVNNCESVVSS